MNCYSVLFGMPCFQENTFHLNNSVLQLVLHGHLVSFKKMSLKKRTKASKYNFIIKAALTPHPIFLGKSTKPLPKVEILKLRLQRRMWKVKNSQRKLPSLPSVHQTVILCAKKHFGYLFAFFVLHHTTSKLTILLSGEFMFWETPHSTD